MQQALTHTEENHTPPTEATSQRPQLEVVLLEENDGSPRRQAQEQEQEQKSTSTPPIDAATTGGPNNPNDIHPLVNFS